MNKGILVGLSALWLMGYFLVKNIDFYEPQVIFANGPQQKVTIKKVDKKSQQLNIQLDAQAEKIDISNDQDRIADLASLVETDNLCLLVEKYKNLKLGTLLEVFGRIQPNNELSSLDQQALNEIFSAQSPLVGAAVENYISVPARYFKALGHAGLLAGAEKSSAKDLRQALVELEKLSLDDYDNIYPQIFKSFVMKELGSSADEVRDELIQGMRRRRAQSYTNDIGQALLSRGFNSPSAMFLAIQAYSILPIGDFHNSAYKWISDLIHNDEDVAHSALGLGYVMTSSNWFKGEPLEEYKKSLIEYGMGRALWTTAHKSLYPEFRPPNLPKVHEMFQYTQSENHPLYFNPNHMPKLAENGACERLKFDRYFDKLKKAQLDYEALSF